MNDVRLGKIVAEHADKIAAMQIDIAVLKQEHLLYNDAFKDIAEIKATVAANHEAVIDSEERKRIVIVELIHSTDKVEKKMNLLLVLFLIAIFLDDHITHVLVGFIAVLFKWI